jgi:small-conductance mechanosensitive channel
MTFGRPGWLIALFLLTAALPLSALAKEDPRIVQLTQQIRTTRQVLADTTDPVEKVDWEKRISLLELDLKNLRTRIALEEKENRIASRVSRNPLYALRETLASIDTDVRTSREASSQLVRKLHILKTERAELAVRMEKFSADPEANAESLAEIDEVMRNKDEEVRLYTLQHDQADLKARLASEATRIDESARAIPVNPRPTVKLILDKRAYIREEDRQRQDLDALRLGYRQSYTEISNALALAETKFANIDAEISALEKKRKTGVSRQFSVLLYIAKSQKDLLEKRIEHHKNQLAASDDCLAIVELLAGLYDKEVAFLDADVAALTQRYIASIISPLLCILVVILVFTYISRRVLPKLYDRNRLFIARRLGGYVVFLIILIVLVLFFLEDLKPIATILGIAGAALVIALQDLFSSLAGWFVIVGSRKLKVGDRVEIDGTRGDVVDIQLLRTTLLELNNWLGVDEATGRVITVPNSFIFKGKVFNYTHVHPFIWGRLDVTVTYETPQEEARALLQRIMEEETREEFIAAANAGKAMEKEYGVPDTLYKPKVYSLIADSGIQFILIYVSHYRHCSSTRNRINERLIAEFSKDPRMQFAYPTERHIPTPEQGSLHVTVDGAPRPKP